MSTKIYTMTIKTQKSLMKLREATPTCHTCGKKLEVGQQVLRTSSRTNARLRHIECAKKVGMI